MNHIDVVPGTRAILQDVTRKRTVETPDGPKQATEVGFRTAGEHWNEYLLDDGSVLRLKLVVTSVVRIEDTYDNDGNPVYMAQSTNVLGVSSPDELRRK